MFSNMGLASVHCMKCLCEERQSSARVCVCSICDPSWWNSDAAEGTAVEPWPHSNPARNQTISVHCQGRPTSPRELETYQLIKSHLWTLVIKQVPPRCSTDCSKTHISYGGEKTMRQLKPIVWCHFSYKEVESKTFPYLHRWVVYLTRWAFKVYIFILCQLLYMLYVIFIS